VAGSGTLIAGASAAGLAALLMRPESEWSLSEAALLAAREVSYPDLAVDDYQAVLLEAGLRLALRVPVKASLRYRLAALNEHMFRTLGYAGDTSEYYDPRNSFLNEVIDRRLGIPITLSIIYLELGRHAGLALAGVSYPGHFLVKLELEGGIAVLDPFQGGASLDESELQRRLSVSHASAIPPPLPQVLQAASRREILTRLLRNLKLIYLQRESWEQALAVCNGLVAASKAEPGELRDRGLVLEQLDCPGAAAHDLESYLALDPQAEDAEDIRRRLLAVRALATPPN